MCVGTALCIKMYTRLCHVEIKFQRIKQLPVSDRAHKRNRVNSNDFLYNFLNQHAVVFYVFGVCCIIKVASLLGMSKNSYYAVFI